MTTESRTVKAPREGWSWLFNSRKWHYFRGNKSLCRRWMVLGSPLEEADADSPDNCVACARARKAELAKATRSAEARHGPSGLIVRFHPAPDDPAESDGEAVNSGEVYDALIARHGIKEAVRMLARLMREAGDAYRERS